MKRQTIRKTMIFISFLLFPVTIFYFSPYIIIHSAGNGIINGSFIIFVFMLFFGMFFGRFLCGWIMPCAGLQESCFYINNKNAKGGRYNYIKFLIWIPWLLTIIFFVIKAGGYIKINPLYKIPYGVSISFPWKFVIYYIVVSIFFLLSFIFGKRASCHYICWMAPFMITGRKVRNLLRLPALQLKADKEKCTECRLCNKACPMSLNVLDMVQQNIMENSECILCGACIDTCKFDVIRYSFGRS